MVSSHQNICSLEPSLEIVECYDKLISLGYGGPLPIAERIPVHYIFKKIACSQPNKIAIESSGKKITYFELHHWAMYIAKQMKSDQIGIGARVAIMIEPSIAMVAAVLGTLYSGAAYVALDHALPDERLTTILNDAKASSIICDDASIEKMGNFGLKLIKLDENFKKNPSVLNESFECGLISMDQPAYLIYTSGSSGEPKGVEIEHNQLFDSTLARQTIYPGSANFLLISPLAFDSSIAGLWGTLTTGGKLIVATKNQARDPEILVELIHTFSITRLLCIPSLYSALLDVAERGKKSYLSKLNIVIVAGETLPDSLVKRHFALHGNTVALINEYGPTETTVWATYHCFHEQEPVSIGRPIPGIQLYVLDENQKLVPQGTSGELYISGSQVARGYFGRKDLTELVFTEDIFNKKPGIRMYRTGDLVRWGTNGTLEFIGRIDKQVKIRGHRIELEAIENAIRGIEGIRDAVVMPNSDHTSLIAFILSHSIDLKEIIRTTLASKLPAIMIPSDIHQKDKFPLTINGKVDRMLLSQTIIQTGVQSVADIKAENVVTNEIEMLEKVLLAWKEVLQIDSVPLEINFFDLGGHSLMVFKLAIALERHTGKRPSVVTLFRHTTVSSQAKLIWNETTNATSDIQNAALDPRRARALRAQRRMQLESA